MDNPKENVKHAIETGLTNKHGVKVYKYDINMNLSKTYESIYSAAKEISLHVSVIDRACKNGKLLNGFYWKRDTYKTNEIIDFNNYKQIPNTSYYVSTTGNIYNIRTKKHLKPMTNAHGYNYITLSLVKKKQNKYIHILVASLFLEKEPDKTQVNHKNKNRRDNNIANLEWVTPSENMIHAYKK